MKYPKGFFATSNKETIRIIQRFFRESSLEKKVIEKFPISFSSGEESKEEVVVKDKKDLKRKRSDEEEVDSRNVKMKKDDLSQSSSSSTCPIEKYWKSLASSSSSSSSSSQPVPLKLPYIILKKKFKDTELERLKRICSQIDQFKGMDGGYYVCIILFKFQF